MKQRIAAAMLITLIPLSLAACGGEKANSSSATPSSESSSTATQNTAPAGNQSKEDACKEIEKAMADASETVTSATSEMGTDPASIKNAFDSIADAYATASEKISNEDIKKSVDQVTADWRNPGEKAPAKKAATKKAAAKKGTAKKAAPKKAAAKKASNAEPATDE